MSYKKKIVALAILVTSLACSNSSIEKDTNNLEIEINDYKIGNIYIGNQEYLDSIEDIKSNDVLVLDLRDRSGDPDIKIIDSYKIIDSDSMDKVLNTIIQYEKDNPSDWNRTFESMKYEWIVHNFAYSFQYERERSKDVDLNNEDEIKYSKQLVKNKDS